MKVVTHYDEDGREIFPIGRMPRPLFEVGASEHEGFYLDFDRTTEYQIRSVGEEAETWKKERIYSLTRLELEQLAAGIDAILRGTKR